jgi:hypothetical protein
LVGSLHPTTWSKPYNPDHFCYERRPESTAYIPFGKGKNYLCGAFNGGTADAYLQMCKILSKNVRIDLEKNIIARVDDESHMNAYMADKNYLLAGRSYLFPEGELHRIPQTQQVLVKIISRKKDSPKWGGTDWLRGATDRKMPPEHSLTPVLRVLCKILCWFVPNRQTRHKIRSFYGIKNIV